MNGKTKETWVQLCEQAANEQDRERLIQLVKEIDRMLGEKEKRLVQKDRSRTPPDSSISAGG